MKESNNVLLPLFVAPPSAPFCTHTYIYIYIACTPSVAFDLPPFLFHLPLRERAHWSRRYAALCSRRRVRYFITSRSICHAVCLALCVCVSHNSISAPVLPWCQCLHRDSRLELRTAMSCHAICYIRHWYVPCRLLWMPLCVYVSTPVYVCVLVRVWLKSLTTHKQIWPEQR